jgi:hypothetical protein
MASDISTESFLGILEILFKIKHEKQKSNFIVTLEPDSEKLFSNGDPFVFKVAKNKIDYVINEFLSKELIKDIILVDGYS